MDEKHKAAAGSVSACVGDDGRITRRRGVPKGRLTGARAADRSTLVGDGGAGRGRVAEEVKDAAITEGDCPASRGNGCIGRRRIIREIHIRRAPIIGAGRASVHIDDGMVGCGRVPEIEDAAKSVSVLATDIGAARADDESRGRSGGSVVKNELGRAVGAAKAALDRPLREGASRGAINKGDHVIGLVWVAELGRSRNAEGLEDAGVVHYARPNRCWAQISRKVDRVSARALVKGKCSKACAQATGHLKNRRDIGNAEGRGIGDCVGDRGGRPV